MRFCCCFFFLRDRRAISSLSMMFVFAVSPLIKSMSKVGHCASERTQLEHTTIVLLMCPYINLLWDVLFSFSRSTIILVLFFSLFLFSSLFSFFFESFRLVVFVRFASDYSLFPSLWAFSIRFSFFLSFFFWFSFDSFLFVLNSTQPFVEVDY